jgi:hypothetical protein
MSRLTFPLPSDFGSRCSETKRHTESGEAMTIQQLADALGLPFEFVGAAVAISEALLTGRPVVVDPAPSALPN